MKFKVALLWCCLLSLITVSSAKDNSAEISWHECVTTAFKNNPLLTSAREKINQSRANAGITRSALLPNLSADASGTKQKTGNTDSTRYSYGISGKQALFDGEGYYNTKSADTLVNSAVYRYKVVSSDLRLNLRVAYLNLLKTQELLEIAKKIEKLRDKNYRLVNMMHNAGQEHRGALLTSRANLARARFDVTQSLRGIHVAQRQLACELGLRATAPLKVPKEYYYHTDSGEKPDFETIARNNPLLQDIISQREAACYDLKAAKMNFFPKVYGFFSAAKTGSSPVPKDTELSAGVQMSLSFDGGEKIYRAKKANSLLRQLDADTLDTRNSVLLILEEKWTELLNRKDNVRVQQIYLEAAEERSKIAEAQYSVGLITFDNWIIIQDALVSAMKAYLNAKVDALYADAEWIQAKGETLDYDRKK